MQMFSKMLLLYQVILIDSKKVTKLLISSEDIKSMLLAQKLVKPLNLTLIWVELKLNYNNIGEESKLSLG